MKAGGIQSLIGGEMVLSNKRDIMCELEGGGSANMFELFSKSPSAHLRRRFDRDRNPSPADQRNQVVEYVPPTSCQSVLVFHRRRLIPNIKDVLASQEQMEHSLFKLALEDDPARVVIGRELRHEGASEAGSRSWRDMASRATGVRGDECMICLLHGRLRRCGSSQSRSLWRLLFLKVKGGTRAAGWPARVLDFSGRKREKETSMPNRSSYRP
ncbi:MULTISPECIES: hypothetical protein [unclassified Phyllobacterium]|uniref:hypothetical protein n=1 Tax=unclassified Phyllobacterium TaxID=2638441 RepID=UPI002B26D75B|nr:MULTISPECIES: hypothetical protein [unclassified Phyllobacterium]